VRALNDQVPDFLARCIERFGVPADKKASQSTTGADTKAVGNCHARANTRSAKVKTEAPDD